MQISQNTLRTPAFGDVAPHHDLDYREDCAIVKIIIVLCTIITNNIKIRVLLLCFGRKSRVDRRGFAAMHYGCVFCGVRPLEPFSSRRSLRVVGRSLSPSLPFGWITARTRGGGVFASRDSPAVTRYFSLMASYQM